jgi:ATP-dependent DNA ligase
MFSQEKIDKYYKGATVIEAMELWTLPKHKKHMLKEVCASGKYFAQLKKDGNWYAFNKGIDGQSFLFSRGVSTKTGLPVNSIENVPHLISAFKELPNDTVLVGEIYYPNETSDEVRSIMGCLPPKALARQLEKGKIHYYVHDILKYKGTDLKGYSALDRYLFLEKVFNKYSFQSEFIELAEKVEENIFEFIGNALEDGEEGGVLKLKTAVYTEGKRPAWSMIKVKKQDEADFVCIGFEDATKEYTGGDLENWEYWYDHSTESFVKGRYYNHPENCFEAVTKPYFNGLKTSIRIGAYAEEGKLVQIGTVSSGLTDAMRKAITLNPQNYIGLVVTCTCMEINENTLRHPIFIKFRKDKPATSCTMQSIFNN